MAKKKKSKDRSRPVSRIPKKNKPEARSAAPAGTVDPIKVLIWGAAPLVPTGFGNVMRHMLSGLFRKYPGQYDIAQMSINYYGDYVDEFQITGGPTNGRYRQWPAATQRTGLPMSHMFGQARFIELVKSIPIDLDVVFLAEDPFWLGGSIPTDPENGRRIFIDEIKKALHARGLPHVPIVGYFPIDGIPDPEWIQNISKYDLPITYLPFGAKSVEEVDSATGKRTSIMPLGIDPKEFHVLPPQETRAFKRAYFGEQNVDKYVILNCNRNQIRKFLPANLLAFKQYKDKFPDSIMYLHMKDSEMVGWNLPRACKNIGLEIGEDVFFPANFNVNRGVSVSDLNSIFNVADMLTTTALGGGWELAVTQAFATNTVVVAPKNTSHNDLCSEGRGVLYECGNRLALRAILRGDNEVIRPLPDTDDMVEKMIWVRENPEEVLAIKERAHQWVQTSLLWDDIIPRWHHIFTRCKQFKNERLHDMRQQQQALQQTKAPAINNPTQGIAASVDFEES